MNLGKDKTTCYYCQRQLKLPDPIRKDPLFRTKDHVVPQSRGGRGNAENIVYCCSQCNTSKGSRSLWQWEGHLSRTFGRIVIQTLNHRLWKAKIPNIIKNIQRHPLYKPEIEVKSFRQFREPSQVNNGLINGQDPCNFHEEYITTFQQQIQPTL